MTRLTLSLAAALFASSALAGGDALVIGNARYSTLDTMFGTARLSEGAQGLRDVGLDVTEVTDASAVTMRRAFAEFVEGVQDDDGPIIVILSGVFMHGTGGAYLLPVQRNIDNAAEVMTRALPLDAVMTVLARHPGRALLVLGETAVEDGLAPYLMPGPGQLDIPQGVTVLRGPAADAARFAASDLLTPGSKLTAGAARWELTAEGFAPDALVILRRTDVVEKPAGTQQNNATRINADNAAWARAQDQDSKEGYEAYLKSYPEGLHAGAALQRIAGLAEDPFYRERRTEEQLELSRDMRRKLQRDLSLLGFDTRGIDGIFGRGTRSAIQQWQRANGMRQSGFLDAGQINQLDSQSRARASELEEQAKQERAAQERRDRAAWDRIRNVNDERGLRAYLEAYPDGIFADRAQILLDDIVRDRQERAAELDRRAWQRAQQADSEASYRRYLEENPQGAFRADAEARLRRLGRSAEDARAEARAREAESRLNMNPVARRLAEARLEQLGLKPGVVDGRFDADTRRAIRQYQQARRLEVTGYLDQNTVVRLLADSILRR